MKVPKGLWIGSNSKYYEKWNEEGIRLSVEYGVFVETEINNLNDPTIHQEIYYKVGDHRFDSLKDLKKALRNRAFL